MGAVETRACLSILGAPRAYKSSATPEVTRNSPTVRWRIWACAAGRGTGVTAGLSNHRATAAQTVTAVARRWPCNRVKKELAGLKAWYATLGNEFDPLR
jgi:hypothetical protein